MEFPNIVAEQYYARAEAWLPSVIARAPEITSADKAFEISQVSTRPIR